MSTPENPLAIYRTYSYHHVLIGCNTSTVAEHIAKSEDLSVFLRDDATSENRYKKKDIADKGSYVIIINGLTDAEFSIESLSWFATTAADTGSNDNRFTTMATEGEMTILEPAGIRFLNVINNVANELETDPNGVVWMIKTIFVGHRQSTSQHDVGDYPDYFLTVKPLTFVIYDITANFEISGGEYTISFCALANGAAKQPHYISAAESVTITLGEDNSLKAALDALQLGINTRYGNYVEVLKHENPQLVGRELEYRIMTDDPNYLDGTYKVDQFNQQNTTQGEDKKGAILNFAKEKSVEAAIQQIMSSSGKVQKDLKAEKEKDRYIYKVVSTLSSTTTKVIVTYKVIRFQEASNTVMEGITSGTISEDTLKENLLEFDYIYTGRNVDILNFDIKMEMGLAFFQTMQTSSTLKHVKEEGSTTSESGSGNSPGPAGGRKLTPIYFPKTNDNPKNRNVPDPVANMEFQQLLARHAALENIDVKMTIHGNIGLLNSTVDYPSDINKSADQLNKEADKSSAIPHWGRVPAIAKVNIKMPSIKKDNPEYAETFWYDGYYYIYAITNKFDAGLFTQELEMVSLPNTEKADDLKTNKPKPEKKPAEERPKKTTQAATPATTATTESTSTSTVTTKTEAKVTVGPATTTKSYPAAPVHCESRTAGEIDSV